MFCSVQESECTGNMDVYKKPSCDIWHFWGRAVLIIEDSESMQDIEMFEVPCSNSKPVYSTRLSQSWMALRHLHAWDYIALEIVANLLMSIGITRTRVHKVKVQEFVKVLLCHVFKSCKNFNFCCKQSGTYASVDQWQFQTDTIFCCIVFPPISNWLN